MQKVGSRASFRFLCLSLGRRLGHAEIDIERQQISTLKIRTCLHLLFLEHCFAVPRPQKVKGEKLTLVT